MTTYEFFSKENISFYEMGIALIKEKQDYKESCRVNGYEVNEMWEDKILDMEEHYKKMCKQYNQEASEKALSW